MLRRKVFSSELRHIICLYNNYAVYHQREIKINHSHVNKIRGLATVCPSDDNLPRLPEVAGSLDEHGSRTKRLELHDDVGEMELGFEVQLDRDVIDPCWRLPPTCLLRPLVSIRRNDVANSVTSHRVAGIADETTVVVRSVTWPPLFQTPNDAVALGAAQTTRGARRQPVGTADQEVAGCRVTTAALARRGARCGPHNKGQMTPNLDLRL